MADANKNLTEPQIKYVIREILEALAYLHDKCFVIHRDMKAGNLLLTENGSVKLCDFGVSSIYHKEYTRNTFIGTPYWYYFTFTILLFYNLTILLDPRIHGFIGCLPK
jgi:serine/threonine protein kinase